MLTGVSVVRGTRMQAQQEVKQMQDDIDNLKVKAKDIQSLIDQRKSAQPAAAAAPSELSGYQARALFNFTGHTEQELSFQAGDVINLIDAIRQSGLYPKPTMFDTIPSAS